MIKLINYVAVGRRIKDYRLRANLRQSDVAEKLDVSVSYISQVECGTTDVSLKRLDEIATLINTTVSVLLADSDDQLPNYLHSEIVEKISDWNVHNKKLLIGIINAIERANE